MRTLTRIYLILAVVFAVIGVVQCVRWGRVASVTPYYLIHFLPAAAFWVGYIATRRKPLAESHTLAIILGVFSVGVWAFVSLIGEIVIQAATEVTNVRKYEKILDDYWSFDPELVRHFPRPIPRDARNVRFSFLPRFLQGGAHIQLRYATSPEEIRERHEAFSKRKTKSFSGGDTNDHMNMPEGMPTTFFHTGDSDKISFTEDYEIMIFDEIIEEKDRSPGFDWNHGQSHGVAISTERNEIVYWAEAW